VVTHVSEGGVDALEPAGLNDSQKSLRCLVHDTIAKVSDDVGRRNTFNTAIAAMMELSNHLARHEDRSVQDRAVLDEGWQSIVRMLAPVTPHICEELWSIMGHEELLANSTWPEADESARVKTSITIVVQVNGKLRAQFETVPGASREAVQEIALAEANVQRHIEGKAIRKIIHVPDKLLNIVVS
jgi:leucyl-tRNA synthetase